MTADTWDIAAIDTIDDPRLAAFRDLTDVDLRSRLEPEAGFFIAEGLLVIARAVSAGLSVKTVLTTPKWLPRLEHLLTDWSGSVLVADEALLRDITGYRVHRGALAQVQRPALRPLDDLLLLGGHLLALEDLVDHTNVGLAFRSAAALGICGIVLSPRCADPLYRRSVKTSMGAVFTLPWTRADDWAVALDRLGAERSVIALSLEADADPIERALSRRAREGVVLLAGSEGPGLSAHAYAHADQRARIPMSGEIDSLNVAAAVAVACYALRMVDRTEEDA